MAAQKTPTSKRRRSNTADVILPDRVLAAIYADVERYIGRWLRRVIIVGDDGLPRKLTEAEIADGVKATRAENRREWANERRRRERARRRRAARKTTRT